MDTLPDIVGYREIIDRARAEFDRDFALDTVRGWEKYRRAWDAKGRPARSAARRRELPLPDPIATVNGTPAWSWAAVREWLVASGKVE